MSLPFNPAAHQPADDADDPFPSISTCIATLNDPASSEDEITEVVQKVNRAGPIKCLEEDGSSKGEELIQALVHRIERLQSEEVWAHALGLLKRLLIHPSTTESSLSPTILPQLISLIKPDSGRSIATRTDLLEILCMLADHSQCRDQLISSDLIENLLPECKVDADSYLLFAAINLLMKLFWIFSDDPATFPEKLNTALPALAEIFLTLPMDANVVNTSVLQVTLGCCFFSTSAPEQYQLLLLDDWLPRLIEVLSQTKSLTLKCSCLRMIGQRLDEGALFVLMTDHNGLSTIQQCLEKPHSVIRNSHTEEMTEEERSLEEEPEEDRKDLYLLAISTLQTFSEHEDSIPFLISSNMIQFLLPHLRAVNEYDPIDDHRHLILCINLLDNIGGEAVDQIPHEQAAECVQFLLELLNDSHSPVLVDHICSTLIPLYVKEHQPTVYAMLHEAAQVISTQPDADVDAELNESEQEEYPAPPHPSMIHRLIDLMQTSQLSFWVMRLLYNLMKSSIQHLSIALSYKNGLILRRVHLILQHENPKFREEAMWFILYAARYGSTSDIQCILDSGIVKVLLQVMENGEKVLQTTALSTIGHLVMSNRNVTEEQRKYFFDPVPARGDAATFHCGIDLLTFLFSILQTTSDVSCSVNIMWLAEFLIVKSDRDAALAAGAPYGSADLASSLQHPAMLSIAQRWYRLILLRISRSDLVQHLSHLQTQSFASLFTTPTERILAYAEEVERDGLDLQVCDGEDAIGILCQIIVHESNPEAPVRTIDEIQSLHNALPEQIEILANVSERLPRWIKAADAIRCSIVMSEREVEEYDHAFQVFIQSSLQRILDAGLLPRLTHLFETTESEVLQYHTLVIISWIIPTANLEPYSFLPILLSRIRTSSQIANIELMDEFISTIRRLHPPQQTLEANHELALQHYRKLASETSLISDLFGLCQSFSNFRVLSRVIQETQYYFVVPRRDMNDYQLLSGVFRWAAQIFSFAIDELIFTRICVVLQRFLLTKTDLADASDDRLSSDIVDQMNEDVMESGLIPHLLRLLHHPSSEISRSAFDVLHLFVSEWNNPYGSYLLSDRVNLLDVFTPFLAAYSAPTNMRRKVCSSTYSMIFSWCKNDESRKKLVQHEELMVRLIKNVRHAKSFAKEEKPDDEEEEKEEDEEEEKTDEEKSAELVKEDEQYQAALALCALLDEMTPVEFSRFIRKYRIVLALCRTVMYQRRDHPVLVIQSLHLIHRLVCINPELVFAELIESDLPHVLQKLIEDPGVHSEELRQLASQMYETWFKENENGGVEEENQEEKEEEATGEEEPEKCQSPPLA